MEAGCFNCSCGTCAAEVVSGMENISEPTDEELDVLDQWNKDPEKFRLTCCNRILKARSSCARVIERERGEFRGG